MPSPLGHMLGGIAAGWVVSGTPSARGARIREAALFACLGALPDLDLLVGAHRGPTHSIGAALIVGVAVGVLRLSSGVRWPAATGFGAGVACAAAYGSHVLLDWLSSDTSAPIGIMALWPFTRTHYESDLHVFMAVSRRYYQGWAFVRQNLLPVVRELGILAPIVLAVTIARRRRQES